jgi:hypothetical protein
MHSVPFDSRGLSDGVYFYRLAAGSQAATAKVMIVH